VHGRASVNVKIGGGAGGREHFPVRIYLPVPDLTRFLLPPYSKSTFQSVRSSPRQENRLSHFFQPKGES
jgi:hypothetical protein